MSDNALTPSSTTYRVVLSAALRGVREARRLRVVDLARAMDMPPRSYEHFEAGRGRFDLDRLQRFADATDSDPFSILASVLLQTPEFAVRTADNKPLVVLMMALRDFSEELRDDIALIDPRVFAGAFRRVFQDLTDHVRKGDLAADTWMDTEVRKLGLNLSFRRGVPRRAKP